MEENESRLRKYPTNFQKRMFWTALTAASFVLIASIAVGAIALGGKILGFLQPILVPIAIAGIMAYLLEPLITILRRKTRWSYKTCMMTVFFAFLAAIVILIINVVVPGVGQAREVIEDWDTHKLKISQVVKKSVDDLQTRINTPIAKKYYDKGIGWISVEGPELAQKAGLWTWEKIIGAFGLFGYLLGLILVPVYLFFFLKESHSIKKTWSDYLPLRASKFKDEVVSTLKEINQYLISFFRGQMVVSLIDGALVAIALSLIGLPNALLIGVFLAILGLIPYIGNALVMIPAVIIAMVHFGHRDTIPLPPDSQVEAGQLIEVEGKKRYVTKVKKVTRVDVLGENGEALTGFVPAADTPVEPGTVIPVNLKGGVTVDREIVNYLNTQTRAEYMANAWSFLPNMWFYPLIVLAIFFLLQQINGLVTAPKIVGDSVGLHPLTVIFSVLFWSFLLGGLLGAILAVPLTAAIKVLFRRYIWVKRIEPKVGPLGESENRDTDEEPEAEPA